MPFGVSFRSKKMGIANRLYFIMAERFGTDRLRSQRIRGLGKPAATPVTEREERPAPPR